MANGSRHSLYIVEETVRGTTPNNPELHLLRNTGTTLALNKDSLQPAEIRSDRMVSDFRMGANQVGGDISGELSYGTFDKLIAGALFAAAPVANAPVTGRAQIKAGSTRHSFTVIRHFADITDKPYQIFRGVEINSMQLRIAANAITTCVFSVVGQSMELAADLTGLGTPTYAAPTTTRPMDSFTSVLKEGIGGAATAIGVVTEINLNLQNGIGPRFVIGSKNSIDPEVGRSLLTGQVTAYFEDTKLLQKFLDEDESALEIGLNDPDGNQYNVVVPRLVYTAAPPDVSGEGSITLAMPIQALLDATLETNIAIDYGM